MAPELQQAGTAETGSPAPRVAHRGVHQASRRHATTKELDDVPRRADRHIDDRLLVERRHMRADNDIVER